MISLVELNQRETGPCDHISGRLHAPSALGRQRSERSVSLMHLQRQ